MATVATKIASQAGAGEIARPLVRKALTLTMAAGATVQGTITVPAGSELSAVQARVGTLFSGSPTNINLSLGTAAAGAQVVANTDIKAVGNFNPTIAAAFDTTGATTVYHVQLAAVGGTNPAGSATVYLNYFPPVV